MIIMWKMIMVIETGKVNDDRDGHYNDEDDA